MPDRIVEPVRIKGFFKRESQDLSPWEVIGWWESRRIPYNLAVGIAGMISCILIFLASGLSEEGFNAENLLPDPPIAAVFGVVFYAMAANACYTLGWLAEIVISKQWKNRWQGFAPVSLALGTVFSLLLTLIPGILACCITLVQYVSKLSGKVP